MSSGLGGSRGSWKRLGIQRTDRHSSSWRLSLEKAAWPGKMRGAGCCCPLVPSGAAAQVFAMGPVAQPAGPPPAPLSKSILLPGTALPQRRLRLTQGVPQGATQGVRGRGLAVKPIPSHVSSVDIKAMTGSYACSPQSPSTGAGAGFEQAGPCWTASSAGQASQAHHPRVHPGCHRVHRAVECLDPAAAEGVGQALQFTLLGRIAVGPDGIALQSQV